MIRMLPVKLRPPWEFAITHIHNEGVQ